MSPFEQLRRDDGPEAPSPRFAALLRTQIEAALDAIRSNIVLPERSPAMSLTDTTTPATTPPVTAAQVVPYLCVDGAARALEWYASAFDAVETIRYAADDGRIGHAEMLIDGAKVMLSDPYPEIGVDAPGAAGSSVSLNVNVADVDAVFARAVAGGAVVQREPEDQPYGERSCTIVDPFGHRWMIQSTIAAPTLDEINAGMEGFTATAPAPASPQPAGTAPIEVGYLTIGFDDTTKATAFYGSLFGWVTEPGHMGDEYAHIENTKLPMGMSPAGVHSAPVLYFRVEDAAAMGRRAVELGGTILEQADYESGGDVVCLDDQGREFHLWQPAPGY